MEREDIAVYLFCGFLEAGKTKFIQDVMEDSNFNSGENTLLLLCEEGIEEFDTSKFSGKNVNIKMLDDVKDLNPKNLSKLADENNAERVVIEYNGMWQIGTLFENLPENWTIYQIFTIVDYTTFENYNANMRSLVFDKIIGSDMVVFNRVDPKFDKLKIHKIVRAINSKVQIAYEYTNGESEMDNIKDPLPYDMKADVVEIKDKDYAEFYRDITENEMNYNGKVLDFKGIVAVEPRFGKDVFAIGRHVMQCCAADIQYYCLVAKAKEPIDLKTRDWVQIKAKVIHEYHEAYGGEGPVLHILDMKKAAKADPEVATF